MTQSPNISMFFIKILKRLYIVFHRIDRNKNCISLEFFSFLRNIRFSLNLHETSRYFRQLQKLIGAVHKLLLQPRGRGLFKCQRTTTQADEEGDKNPQNHVNVDYECPHTYLHYMKAFSRVFFF